MAVSRLVTSALAVRKVRAGLTIAAIALAVSLVVSITSGYTSAQSALQKLVYHWLGASDVQVSPKGDPHQVTPQSVVEELRGDFAVESAVGRLETEVSLGTAKGEPIAGPPVTAIGAALPQDAQVAIMEMKDKQGEWFTGATGDVAVTDQIAAERLQVKVGDQFTLLHPERPLTVTLVGIVHKPAILAAQIQTIYVPLETLQKFVGLEGKVNRVLIDLKMRADDAAFVARWEDKLAALEPALRMRRAGERRQELEKSFEGVQFLSYMGGTVAMLAATFIVFATLSMGVAERQRSLAMLRAIGAVKRQVGQIVILEGVLFAVVGVLIGVPLGIAWVHIMAQYHQTLFYAGVHVSWGGIAFGVVGMILAAMVASFMPAWSATRVSPLEAMTPLGQPTRPNVPWIAAAIGLLLICIDPFLSFTPGLPKELVFYGHFGLGLPGLFLGFFLLAPAVVFLVERTVGRVVAFILRLDYALLKHQLSGSLWRAAGTAAALMVGLAILVVMQVQGTTMLSGWRLPDKFPDAFIFAPFGLDWEQQRIFDDVPGVRKGEVMPVAIASPQLASSLSKVGGFELLPDATMFFGIDPDLGLKMLELEYRQGNAEEAMGKLKQGRHLIVTDEFRQLKGIGIGDKLTLKTTMNGDVEYTVAAVVWSPGLDVIISAFDMGRQFDQRTAASVFGSLEDARKDFGTTRCYLFAANLEVGVQKEDLVAQMQQEMQTAQTRPSTQPKKNLGFGTAFLQQTLGRLGFQVGDVRHIKYEMQQSFNRILMLLSTVALAAIAVASLGVTNTIMASVRSRQWQFGILRSIGVTRSQLLRLIIAEAVLLGLVACVLGLGAGFLMSVDANALGRTIIGYGPPITVPWPIVFGGTALILLVAVGASLWPAISASRSTPLELLQWGRAAA